MANPHPHKFSRHGQLRPVGAIRPRSFSTSIVTTIKRIVAHREMGQAQVLQDQIGQDALSMPSQRLPTRFSKGNSLRRRKGLKSVTNFIGVALSVLYGASNQISNCPSHVAKDFAYQSRGRGLAMKELFTRSLI
ncbi:hypothetical protein [Noviherbaspirillum sp. Root189]|uniref:hypothetical protein n=1 Tax=Noviherbaspirillum sp. Root189 TaxID=1736487 RepID=UPI0012E379ED|nr:hypothetical protein [Noviherbaspirillum sp. Root189]